MLSLLNFIFLNFAFHLGLLGLLMNTIEDWLPSFITQNFRYGKFAKKNISQKLVVFALPKSYFRHFYVLGTTIVTLSFVSVLLKYHSSYFQTAPSAFISFLNFWSGVNREVTSCPAAVSLSLLLLTIQCWRRLYETFCIQVFASSSKINLPIYIVGHFHYFGCVVAILSHAPGFINSSLDNESILYMDTYTSIVAIPAVTVFIFAWIYQFHSNIILANLRKKDSEVVSQKYFIPKGGLFKYVSCPHLFCEILIYISLTSLLLKNTSWFCILLWVLCNQIETAFLSHQWYKDTFPKYPKERKIIIPYFF